MFLKEAFKSRSRGDYDDYTEFTEPQVRTALEELTGHLSVMKNLMKDLIDKS